MEKLTGNDMQAARLLFEKCNHNQAVIFSIFEGQFDGCVYANRRDQMDWALLQTPLLQHFIAGTPTEGCEAELEEILFSIILGEQSEKEIVVLSDDITVWDGVLRNTYTKRNGVCDGRKIFNFSLKNYRAIPRPTIPEELEAVVELCRAAPMSHFDTWSAKLFVNGKPVTHCDAFAVGKGLAEIDIGTEEAFRGHGYATMAAILLIDKLLEVGLTPTWSTWPFRVESQRVAVKLGFVPQPDATAWIWMEGM